MKIYGPFHALKNPLLAASLGIQALGTIEDIYSSYEKANSDAFLRNSILTGKLQTEMPGGFFKQLASKATGGLVSPNIEASGDAIAQEMQAIRQQEGENLRQAGEVANVREKVGPGPFGAGSAFSSEARRLGLGDLTGPTPGEIQKQQVAERATPEFKTKVLQAEEPVKIDTAVKTAEATAPIKTAGAVATAVATQPLKLGLARATAEATEGIKTKLVEEGAEARVAGTARGVDNLTLGQYRTRPAGKVFVDRATLTPASSDMKVKDANSNPDLVAIAQGKDEQALSETRSMLKQLGQLDRLVDKVFPAMPRSSGLAGDISLTKAGLTHWNNRRTDPTIQRFYAAKGLLIEYIRKMQSRYPSAIELGDIGQELVPEPGGISHYGKPIRSDSNEVAHQKIYQLQQKLKDSYLNAAVESTEESTDDTIDKSLDEAIPSE